MQLMFFPLSSIIDQFTLNKAKRELLTIHFIYSALVKQTTNAGVTFS